MLVESSVIQIHDTSSVRDKAARQWLIFISDIARLLRLLCGAPRYGNVECRGWDRVQERQMIGES